MLAVNLQHLIVIVLAITFAVLTYTLVQRGLGELLTRMVDVPGGIVFFRRAFLLMLLFGVVGPAVSASFEVNPGLHFMEYVWALGNGLEGACENMFIAIGVYLVVITVLVAALKPKDDK